MERLNCLNRQFSKETENRNACVNGTKWVIQEICNESCCKISYSEDCSSKHMEEPEKCVKTYQCDKPSGYVFVDVGSDLIESGYLLEEDDDTCKVSSETLFTDSKDIDYNLVKNVNIEVRLKNSIKENEMNNHNMKTTVCNKSDICSGSDRSSLSTNTCTENLCENLDNYDKKQSIDIDYTTTSTVVSVAGSFEKVNTYVKEEISIEDVLVHQSTTNLNPEIKKEEIVYNEEVSVLDESIIDIKLHEVNKVEESSDIGTNYTHVLNENSKTEFCVSSKSFNSDFQVVCTKYSEKVPDNSDVSSVMVLKPLMENGTVQSKRESHLKLQNKEQTLSRTHNELQIKPQTNSGDETGADGVEERNNKLSEEDVNAEAKDINDAICQYLEKTKPKHTTDGCYVCKGCRKDFTQFCDLEAHRCTNTGDQSFACSTYGSSSTRLADLKVHERMHTGERPFGCSTCGKAFTKLASLKTHEHIHTDCRSFCCSTCGKAFIQLAHLKAHERMHTGERPFSCSTCGIAFTQLTHLKDHERIHTGERPFRCSICSRALTDLANLKAHISTHTGDRPFGCSTCGKAFTQLRCLKDHERIHTGERPFICSTCGKAFRQLANLKVHERIHTGEWFGCSTCGKAFRQQATLKVHERIHTGERPFGCSTCGKAFTQLASLKVHERIHTGGRPFACGTCGKAFTDLANLKAHISIHTGDRPFGCSTCGKAFTQLASLKVHERIHTSGILCL